MNNATELMQKIAQGKPTPELTQRTFDQSTVDAVQYFFARIRTVYGVAKYNKTWPTEGDEKVAKREWAIQIGQYAKDEIDRGFAHTKTMIEKGSTDFMWPNVGLILSGCKRYLTASHKPVALGLPEPVDAFAKRKEVGLKHLAILKNKLQERVA